MPPDGLVLTKVATSKPTFNLFGVQRLALALLKSSNEVVTPTSSHSDPVVDDLDIFLMCVGLTVDWAVERLKR